MRFYNLRSNSRIYNLRNRRILYNFKKNYINKNLYTGSKYQTKEWRKNQIWYKTGKKNECELYQREIIQKITKKKCKKTNLRINIENYSIIKKTHPLIENNGFEWTEDFDGIQKKINNIFYYNLKMVCNSGGAQTRTLREVYHFIKCQYEYLLKHPNDVEKKYFINILDGNESYKRKKNFNYLKKLDKYNSISNQIFIGDIKTFDKWYNKFF